MGASYGMMVEQKMDPQNPLVLRCLLHADSGVYDADHAAHVHRIPPGFEMGKPRPGEKHRQHEVQRISGVEAVKE